MGIVSFAVLSVALLSFLASYTLLRCALWVAVRFRSGENNETKTVEHDDENVCLE